MQLWRGRSYNAEPFVNPFSLSLLIAYLFTNVKRSCMFKFISNIFLCLQIEAAFSFLRGGGGGGAYTSGYDVEILDTLARRT